MKYTYTSPKTIYDNDESFLLRSHLFEVASYKMLLMLADLVLIKNTIEPTCLDSMKKIHSLMREILLQIS